MEDIVIPNGITKISAETFCACAKQTIKAPAGSCAEQYAKENNVSFEAID